MPQPPSPFTAPTFHWSTDVYDLTAWNYGARVEKRSHKGWRWRASVGFSIGSGFADSAEEAKRDAEQWITRELEIHAKQDGQ